MGEPFLGEIRMFAIQFAPKGWSDCNGQIMPINENQTLFALLGNRYGGDGRSTFGLPNFKGRVPVHAGQLSDRYGIFNYDYGQKGGVETVTLTNENMPSHMHDIKCDYNPAATYNPTNNVMAVAVVGSAEQNKFSETTNALMSPTAKAGSGFGHNNMPPYTVVRFCICMSGLFPPRN